MTDDRSGPERLEGDLLILARQAGTVDPERPPEAEPPGLTLRARVQRYVQKKWWLAKRRISRGVRAPHFPLLLAGLVVVAWFAGEGLMYLWVEANAVAPIEWMEAKREAEEAARAAGPYAHRMRHYLANHDEMERLLPDLYRECIPADPDHRVLELWVRPPDWGGVHFLDPPIAGTPLGDCIRRELDHPLLYRSFPYVLVLAEPGGSHAR